MPILIRIIAEKIIAVSITVLTFFGININFDLNNPIILPQEQRQELIDKILTNSNPEQIDLQPEKLLDIIEPKITPENNNKILPIQQPILPTTKTEIPYEKQKNAKINLPEELPQKTDSKPTPTNTPEINPIDFIFETISPTNQNQFEKEKNLTQIEDVVVNIICNQKDKNIITINTGSGVIISPRGVVVTNAHIAQYFLLNKSLKYNCALYKEKIPTFGYTAELIFISPDWVKENKTVIKTKSPRGTGKNDYAFLYITGNTNPALKKPTNFPYANFEIKYKPDISDKIRLAGYPGSPNSLADITRSVNLKIDNENSIRDIFTFGDNQKDVISTEHSEVAFKGASGGGIFKEKELDLIAVTVTTGGSGENSYINAITTGYINRDLKEDFDVTISELISGDLLEKSKLFWENYGKSLAEILLAEL